MEEPEMAHTSRASRSHRARQNIVPPLAFEQVMRSHDLTVPEVAQAIGRTPARVRELTRRFGGSSKAFERFVVCLHDMEAHDGAH